AHVISSSAKAAQIVNEVVGLRSGGMAIEDNSMPEPCARTDTHFCCCNGYCRVAYNPLAYSQYLHVPIMKQLVLLLLVLCSCAAFPQGQVAPPRPQKRIVRSEERRVGKECRSRWSAY